jgi:hypothetical protein
MDGVFVAYHNTARVFGFQYVSLEEMDARLFGPESKSADPPSDISAPTRGARVFEKCVKLLEKVTDEVVGVFGERVSPFLFPRSTFWGFSLLTFRTEREMHIRNARALVEDGHMG